MNGHKIISEHPTHYMVMGPDKKAFPIAKAGLSGGMHAQLMKMPRHMDEGGGVGDDDALGTSDAEDSEALSKIGDMFSGPVNAIGGALGRGANELMDEVTMRPPPPPLPGEPQTSGAPLQSAENPDPEASVQQTGFMTPEQAAALPQPQGGGSGVPQSSYLNDINSASDEVKSGIDQTAQAQGQVARDSVAAMQTAVAQAEAHAEANQKALATQEQRYQQLSDNVSNAKIDPNRMWNNAGTANKIGMLAGIIVSGFGANAGQGNMAMNLINKQIDNDIDAQKAEIGKNENLLSANLRQTGNLLAAEAATRADLWATARGQLDLAAARQGGALAQANAQQAKGMFDLKTAPLKQEAAFNSFKMNTLYGGGAGGGQNFDLLNSVSGGRAIKLPDGSVRFATSPKDAEALRSDLASLDSVDQELNRASSFIQNKGTTVPYSQADTEADNIHDNIMLGLGKLHGINRLNEQELKIYDKQAPNPGAFRGANAMVRVNNLRQLVNEKRNAMLGQMVGSFQPAIPAAEAPPVRGTPRAPMTQVKAP